MLVGIAAAVLAVGAVVGGVSWYRARRADAAAAQFQTADVQFQGGHFAEAADAFTTLGRDYGGTPYGKLASLYEGHALARKPDPTGAAAAYSGLPGELTGDRVPAPGSAPGARSGPRGRW